MQTIDSIPESASGRRTTKRRALFVGINEYELIYYGASRMISTRCTACLTAVLLALGTSGCVITLPEIVNTGDVAALDAQWGDTVPEPQRRLLRNEAARCGARLNGHRYAAALSTYLQLTLNGLGGLTSGIGGVLSTQFPSDPTVEDVMIGLAVGGAALTLLTTFIGSLSANPADRLRLHGLGLRSWDEAASLTFNGGSVQEIQAHLVRCARDVAPAPQPLTPPQGTPVMAL